jgi:hypothetical protein
MQVWNKKKTRRRCNRIAQKIPPSITLKKRAHITEQTALQRRKSPRIITRAHMPGSQWKVVPGRRHIGAADPRRLPGLLIFGRRIVLIFSKAVAKVSIHKDGGNQHLKL